MKPFLTLQSALNWLELNAEGPCHVYLGTLFGLYLIEWLLDSVSRPFKFDLSVEEGEIYRIVSIN